MVGSYLPPGFRFHPRDEELVGYYLHRRNEGLEIELEIIPLMDLYKFDPWELPEKSFLPNRDMEWFFFCNRDRKYTNGSRINRATKSGYWKATGKDRKIVCPSSSSSSSIIGCRKTLVFYTGRAPFGNRKDWVMHEYRLCDNNTSQESLNFKGDFALCRVMKRTEFTQKNCETISPAVSSNEPLSDVSCETSYLGEASCDASYIQNMNFDLSPVTNPDLSESGSPKICISPDFILESSSKENSRLQEEESFSLPVFEYEDFFLDSSFNWESMFENYPEIHMNNQDYPLL